MTGEVLAFQRPPVRQAVSIESTVEHTFDVFVREIAAWWPLDPFSFGGRDRISTVTVDRTTGGRVTEHWHDGTERDWGVILDWREPSGFTMTWNVTGEPTEVELRFIALKPNLTRVEVEHRGWERLNDEQLAAACALPGGYLGGAFTQGWAAILGRLKEHIGS
jgi:hypothetical protein